MDDAAFNLWDDIVIDLASISDGAGRNPIGGGGFGERMKELRLRGELEAGEKNEMIREEWCSGMKSSEMQRSPDERMNVVNEPAASAWGQQSDCLKPK